LFDDLSVVGLPFAGLFWFYTRFCIPFIHVYICLKQLYHIIAVEAN
jgi:hypothetical protein